MAAMNFAVLLFFLKLFNYSFSSLQRSVAGVDGSPPNIVFFIADDYGYCDSSFNGCPQIPTPNIDELGGYSISLTSYYVMPVCSPSRASFLTGRYCIHTGIYNVIYGGEPWGLGLDEKILPQYLKNVTNSYSTHAIGKWHLGFSDYQMTPTMRGFDSFYGYYTGKDDYWNFTDLEPGAGESNFYGLDLRSDIIDSNGVANTSVVRNMSGTYATNLFTEVAVQLLEDQDSSKPFFLYLAHLAAHSANPYDPLQAPANVIEKFDYISDPNRRTLAAMIALMDESVGNVTSALKRLGLWDNTIFVFTSDNGGPAAGSDDNYASNYPLRGMKATMWNGGTQVIGLLGGGVIEKLGLQGRQYNNIFHATDWLPTLVSAIGGNASFIAPWNKTLDGLDLWNSLISNSTASSFPGQTINFRSEVLIAMSPDNSSGALRVGSYKLIWGAQQASGYYPPINGTLPSDTTTIRCYPMPLTMPSPQNASACEPEKSPCLFNVIDDPCEQYNLASDFPSLVAELSEKASGYFKTAVPTREMPNIPQGNPALYGGVWTPYVVPWPSN